MNSEVDTSILNSINIKRFTKSVLEEYGAEIDRSNSAKWKVTFPAALAEQLERQHGTLVFDPADREIGAGDLLVQPGTTVFSALLNLVQQPDSIGRLELTEDMLQVNPPDVLRESELTVNVTEFTKQTSDLALTFHFRVQFETPSSFHSEEMFSVTIDPKTQTRLPELTARLTSHLPQLLQQNNEHPPHDVSETTVQGAFDEAQQAVIDRSRPIISEIQTKANDSASERIEEINNWYDQRRRELDQQLADQHKEIREWKEKRRKARKDSTRRKYIKKRREAERELEHLKKEIQQKQQKVNQKETKEIDKVIDRNEINVAVSLLGVTEVTYVRGKLTMALSSAQTDATIEVSYLPATDEFHGLDCHACSQDLTEGVLPRLCANGHLIGDPCSTSCRNCGLTYCDACGTDSEFTGCEVCWTDICRDCVLSCSSCGFPVCDDHHERCESCALTTCHLCGEECSTCGEFYCDDHLELCPDCDEYHCQEHVQECDLCGAVRCETHIGRCNDCNDWVCSDHDAYCITCDTNLCENHVEFCEVCAADPKQEQRGFCHKHTIRCSVGEEVVCSSHREAVTLGSGYVCHDHYKACDSCKVDYSEAGLTDGQCSACRSIGKTDQSNIPEEIAGEFRSVKAGANAAYMVIFGKKLLGRNQLVVYDLQSGTEVHRHSAGMMKQLLGAYE